MPSRASVAWDSWPMIVLVGKFCTPCYHISVHETKCPFATTSVDFLKPHADPQLYGPSRRTSCLWTIITRATCLAPSFRLQLSTTMSPTLGPAAVRYPQALLEQCPTRAVSLPFLWLPSPLSWSIVLDACQSRHLKSQRFAKSETGWDLVLTIVTNYHSETSADFGHT